MAFEQREGQGSLFKNHKREPESFKRKDDRPQPEPKDGEPF